MVTNGRVFVFLYEPLLNILGIFVNGVFQSKIQKQLKYEKQLKILEGQILANAAEFFPKFEKTFSESDKKTFKDNLLPFFALMDEVKTIFREPFPKYEERPPEKWLEIYAKSYTKIV